MGDHRRGHVACARYLAAGVMLTALSTAHAEVRYFSDKSEWEAYLGGSVTLSTNADGIALADEVDTPPAAQTDVGGTLTFGQNTLVSEGGCEVFTVTTPTSFVFDDIDNPNWDNALSVGDANVNENDDFRIIFDVFGDYSAPFAVGVVIIDNSPESGENISAWNLGFDPIESLAFDHADFPAFSAEGTFFGVIADEPISELRFNEASGGDDIAIANLSFARRFVDRDNDGVLDCADTFVDTDDDGIMDAQDADDDNDGFSDDQEVGVGTDPFDATDAPLVTYYTDEQRWRDDIGLPIAEFITSADNLSIASELAAPPTANQALGTKLTFTLEALQQASPDEFCHAFVLQATQPVTGGTTAGRGFTFSDNEGGDIDNYQ